MTPDHNDRPQARRHARRSSAAPDSAKTILVTGGSSGIGFEVASRLARAGQSVHVIARRGERMAALLDEGDVVTHVVDLREESAVSLLAAQLPTFDAVIHCAGGARGSAPVEQGDTEHWRWMWETNVLGTLFLIRAVTPGMRERGTGQIIVVTSVAAFETLPGSSGYSTSKHAQAALTTTLRDELLGTGVRVTEVSPGLVATEFFDRRFPDDPQRAQAVFDGIEPLSAGDVAAAVSYALDQPAHVGVERIILRPTAQGRNGRMART